MAITQNIQQLYTKQLYKKKLSVFLFLCQRPKMRLRHAHSCLGPAASSVGGAWLLNSGDY